MSGHVYLVGCGPGPADLLTLRAARAIAGAEVALHDQLVSEDVLGLLGPSARRVCVGKRAGQGGTDVAWAARLMAREAKAGRIVARLHGGDPAVFGRLAEELEILRAAEVPFEIVPGVSAAFSAAAALGVPLTERGVAASISLGAGSNPGAVAGAPAGTQVFYMARERTPAIARELIEGGWSPGTPAALVTSIGAPAERAFLATLEQWAERPPLPGAAPAVLLVGEVLRNRFTEARHGEPDPRPQRRGLPADLGAHAPRAGAARARAGD